MIDKIKLLSAIMSLLILSACNNKTVSASHINLEVTLDSNYNTVSTSVFVDGQKIETVILHTIPMIEELASYDFLDFNCGCPVPKVIRQQAGSYWLKRQDELIHLVKEMVKISNKPVILTMRIGYSDYKDIVPLCLSHTQLQ